MAKSSFPSRNVRYFPARSSIAAPTFASDVLAIVEVMMLLASAHAPAVSRQHSHRFHTSHRFYGANLEVICPLAHLTNERLVNQRLDLQRAIRLSWVFLSLHCSTNSRLRENPSPWR